MIRNLLAMIISILIHFCNELSLGWAVGIVAAKHKRRFGSSSSCWNSDDILSIIYIYYFNLPWPNLKSQVFPISFCQSFFSLFYHARCCSRLFVGMQLMLKISWLSWQIFQPFQNEYHFRISSKNTSALLKNNWMLWFITYGSRLT